MGEYALCEDEDVDAGNVSNSILKSSLEDTGIVTSKSNKSETYSGNADAGTKRSSDGIGNFDLGQTYLTIRVERRASSSQQHSNPNLIQSCTELVSTRTLST
jgi:hypothetical protein